MTAYDIIEELAEHRAVEEIVHTVCKVARSELDDLAQMIYEALLMYDEKKIVSLYTKGQINYFIVRIVQNQFYSETSQFHAQFRRESRRCSIDVTEVEKAYDEE